MKIGKKYSKILSASNFGTVIPVYLIFAALSVASCEEEPYDPAAAKQQMTGTWKYVEQSVSIGTPNSCQMQISGGSGEGELKIGNFACLNVTINAKMLDDNRLSIPKQTAGGNTFEGTGTVSKYKSMKLDFTLHTGRDAIYIIADCTKQ